MRGVTRDADRRRQAVEILRDGGEQRPPQRNAGPREIRIAGGVDGRQRGERVHGALGCARVGDALDREATKRVRARVLRGSDRPVRDDRRIRLEKRHDE